MATAYQENIVNFIAAGDLSADQYLACYLDSNGKVARQTNAGGVVLGAIAECVTATADGKVVGVSISTKTKMMAGATITPGQAVAVEATTGRVVPASGVVQVCGYYDAHSSQNGGGNAADGDIITVVRPLSLGLIAAA